MLQEQKKAGRWYCAICASPALVFEPHGLLVGESATAYPSVQAKLSDQSKVHQRVVVSGKCVTSKGPGTSVEFSLALVTCLFGEAKAQEVSEQILAQQ